jgi:hypothetical protein
LISGAMIAILVVAFAAWRIYAWHEGTSQSAPTTHNAENQAQLGKPFSVAGGPYIGHWGAHEETLTVNADGTGTERYSDRSICPNAPMAGCG